MAKQPKQHKTREQWLLAAVVAMRPWFKRAGKPCPDVLVSVGFPKSSRGGGGAHAIGQCWQGQQHTTPGLQYGGLQTLVGKGAVPVPPDAKLPEQFQATSAAKPRHQIFISPELVDHTVVLGTLLHEMVHAAAGLECGHKKGFKDLAIKVGLTGRMTATEPTPECAAQLAAVAAKLGPYPHERLEARRKDVRPSRGIRLRSATDETFRVIMPRKVWQELGAPLDLEGEPMVPYGPDEGATRDDEGDDDA